MPVLAEATAHLSWLLSRGYGDRSALKLVGDRFDLDARQREAVGRCACPDQLLRERLAKRADEEELDGGEIAIDGYNLLTTVESALGGGVILAGRDGCYRDLASMRGTWRRVVETLPALELVADCLEEIGARRCRWLLDRPVSNSGRLRALVESVAENRGAEWTVELVQDADRELLRAELVLVSADREVLDGCRCWLNLARMVVARRVPNAWVIALDAGAARGPRAELMER